MDEIVRRASVTQNMIHAQLKALRRRQSGLKFDGIIRGKPANTQQSPGPVEDVL